MDRPAWPELQVRRNVTTREFVLQGPGRKPGAFDSSHYLFIDFCRSSHQESNPFGRRRLARKIHRNPGLLRDPQHGAERAALRHTALDEIRRLERKRRRDPGRRQARKPAPAQSAAPAAERTSRAARDRQSAAARVDGAARLSVWTRPRALALARSSSDSPAFSGRRWRRQATSAGITGKSNPAEDSVFCRLGGPKVPDGCRLFATR
jgi:hypothetical protein